MSWKKNNLWQYNYHIDKICNFDGFVLPNLHYDPMFNLSTIWIYSRSTSVFSELINDGNHSDYYHFRCTFVSSNGSRELCSVYIIGVEVIRMSIIKTKLFLFDCLMVFNATFNTISVISWRLVLLVECFFLNPKQVKTRR